MPVMSAVTVHLRMRTVTSRLPWTILGPAIVPLLPVQSGSTKIPKKDSGQG